MLAMKKLLIIIFIFSQYVCHAEYDSTYVLAVTQKYAIPENVSKGDFVGMWVKALTWSSAGKVRYSIEKNIKNTFAINSSTGLITISDASMINGKIRQQDTIINIIIRTSDSKEGYELDTAKIQVKENSFCRFIDYQYCGIESGTRIQPFSDLDNTAIQPGYGYFIKRGNLINDEQTLFNGHQADAAHPTVVGSYGSGKKPEFTGSAKGEAICFYIGDDTGGNGDPELTRSEYIWFYDLSVRNYNASAFYCRRKSNHIGWYNVEIENCDKDDHESTLVINTSSYADSASYYPFELINCKFDNTSANCSSGCEKSFIKCGVGPAKITNCYFGRIVQPGGGQCLRLTSGNHSEVKHCAFESGVLSTVGNVANIQIRQDNVLIEDCRFNDMGSGLYVTSPSTVYPEIQPDSLTVRNCLFKKQRNSGIYVKPAGASLFPGVGHIFENNKMVDVENGIKLQDCINPIIRYNIIKGGSGAGIVSDVESSQGVSVYYNIIYGFGGNEIDLTLENNVSLYNNVVDGEINLTGASSGVMRNNYFKSFAGTAISSNNIDIDTITTIKHFRNYSNHDYRLRTTAISAINKGINVSLNTDLSGISVPLGSVPDIGAYRHPSIKGSNVKKTVSTNKK